MPEYVHQLLSAMLAAGPSLNVDVKRHNYQLTELLRRPFFAGIVLLIDDATRLFPERAAEIQVEIDEQLRLMAFLMHQLANHIENEWCAADLPSSDLARAIIAATEGVLTGPTA